MIFLAPLALGLSALTIPILLLYMLRLRRRDVSVSSTLLWETVLRDREANAPWQRLRSNWLLLLQLLILAALVFALSRPSITVPTITSGRTAVLLDASASMNATDVQPSRFEAARAQALALVDTLGANDTMAIIRVGAGPQVLIPYTGDHDRLRAALQSAKAGTTSADWNSALTLAAAGAAGARKFSIVVIGDGGLPPDVSAVSGDIRYVPIGASGENVAIGALAVSSTAGNPPELYARLINYGAQSVNVILSLFLDDKLFNAQVYTVSPGTPVSITIDKLPTAFRTIEARLSHPASSSIPDYLSEDDAAYAVYDQASSGRALLMTNQNKFLEQGFASLPGWTTFRGQIDKGLPVDPFDLYVFDGWLPATLPDAPMMIVNPPVAPQTSLLTVTGIIKNAVSGIAAAADPRVAAVKVVNIHVRQHESVLANWATSLITASDNSPLLLAGEYNGRRVAIIPFDLHDSDLPLQIAWPILLSDLGDWYKTPRTIDNNAINGLSAGQSLLLHPAVGADSIQIQRPNGSIVTLPADKTTLVYSNTELPGIYTVITNKGSVLLRREAFAVNLFDPLESNIAPKPGLQIGNLSTSTATQTQDVGQREYWPWIALIALIVLGAEWFVYNRSRQIPKRRIVRFGR